LVVASSSTLLRRALGYVGPGRTATARGHADNRRTPGAARRRRADSEPSFEEKTEYLLAGGINAHTSCAQAVDLLFSTAGTTGIYKASRLEQHFRDVQVLRQHGFLNESRYQSVG
jgi:hypothetical protein